MEIGMLTGAKVVLTIYDPIDHRVTNYSNLNSVDEIEAAPLVQERFSLSDVSSSCGLTDSFQY